jgi:hypothetical protein
MATHGQSTSKGIDAFYEKSTFHCTRFEQMPLGKELHMLTARQHIILSIYRNYYFFVQTKIRFHKIGLLTC